MCQPAVETFGVIPYFTYKDIDLNWSYFVLHKFAFWFLEVRIERAYTQIQSKGVD